MDKDKKIFSFNKNIFKDKKTLVLLALCLLGIAFILLSSGEKNKTDIEFDDKQYVTQLEDKLESVLGSIEGVGDCQVMITLEGSTEYVYSDAFSDSGSKLLKSVEPSVKGVAVICSGGDKTSVKQDVVNTVKSVLNITSARISVCKKSK